MTTTLSDGVYDTLDRLGDQANSFWTRAEIDDYYKEGYDRFVRKTKCIYDQWVLENIPVTGNWQTDFERHLMEQKPGRSLTDQPMHFSAEHERNLGTGGKYGGSYGKSPTPATSPGEAQGTKGSSSGSAGYFDASSTGSVDSALPTKVPGGDLPRSVVEILRVSYDRRTLTGTSTMQLREADPNYQTRQGDPQYFTWDNDGMFYLGIVPNAGGDAEYKDVSGQRGTMREDLPLATATITFTSTVPTADKAVVINGITYTFKATVAAAGQVKIESTAVATMDNLSRCINNSGGTSGAGNDYMPPEGAKNPFCSSSRSSTTLLTLTEREGTSSSTAPDAYTLTSTETTFTLSGSTFSATTAITTVTQEVGGKSTGGFGILRHSTSYFAANAPWGTPKRRHPHSKNILVELYRLGKDLDHNPVEIPDAYKRYLVFYAMARALERPGHGQDMERSQHYDHRFDMGIRKMTEKRDKMAAEYRGVFGADGGLYPDFGLGDPQVPEPEWSMSLSSS